MEKYNFQRQLSRQILVFSLSLVMLFLTLFTGYFFFTTEFYNHNIMLKANITTDNKLVALFQDYDNHLYESSINNNYIDYFIKEENKVKIYQDFYNFNLNNKVKNQMVILDQHKKEIFTSFNELNNYQRAFYESVICQKMDNEINKTLVNSYLFPINNNMYSVSVSRSVLHEDKVVGYIIYYLGFNDLSTYISNEKTDNIVVCDKRNNVIASTSKTLYTSNNKFKPIKDGFIDIEESTYMYQKKLSAHGKFDSYALIYYNQDRSEYFLTFGIIVLFGFAMIYLANHFAKVIALNNSKSIQVLLDAANAIKNGDTNYRIVLKNGDEFESFAMTFNEMINELNQLNKRNIELVEIKRVSEIKQLEAQFNPHFLYNTLEMIRYVILSDPSIASDLILKLTKILRYSINNKASIVSLEEDLQYVEDFLALQLYRFDDRLKYHIEVEEKCLSMKVLKLMIQPLIENSCKYGFEKQANLELWIKGYMVGDDLYIKVIDNGGGIEEERLSSIKANIQSEVETMNNIGLRNILRRLKLLFGTKSDLIIESDQHGTQVTIKIVKEEQDV